MQRRTFAQYATPRPKPKGLDAATTLRHFALVTYAVTPEALAETLPSWLSPLIVNRKGVPRALVSVVSFLNAGFRSAVFPSPSLNMAQINYRAYVIDRRSGRHAIWFLGTLLDGWAFLAPRLLWKMPWRKGPIALHCELDERTGKYKSYTASSTSAWAPVDVELTEDGADAGIELPGFPDTETGLVCLTHVSNGFFRRTDGSVGVSRVWHRPIPVRPARLERASFPLLERMGLVSRRRQARPYSVLLAPEVEFLSLLPPLVVDET